MLLRRLGGNATSLLGASAATTCQNALPTVLIGRLRVAQAKGTDSVSEKVSAIAELPDKRYRAVPRLG